MAEVNKVLYIVVVDDEEKREKGKDGKESFRYTRPVLQSTLQLMGCKPRHAFKISKRVFELMRNRSPVGSKPKAEKPSSDASRTNEPLGSSLTGARTGKVEGSGGLTSQKEDGIKSLHFELYKIRTTVMIKRETFLDVVCDVLAEYKYVGPNQRADLILACRIRERKESMTVLLCGTSGCGKSTLSSLLGSRLGITTVISTDSIRHMMRSFVDEKENPLLWASTYHAGEYLDPIAVAEAKAKRKARKMAGISRSLSKDAITDDVSAGKSDNQPADAVPAATELIRPKQMAVEGFKAQSEMVIDSLDRLITAWEDRKESVIVEGVHLSLNFVMGLMKKHPSIIPFMIYITNEDKHLERFAVRAKYMTLDPAKNKYVKYIRNIRTIQEYLCNRADKHLVPKINNTNVDKSVAAIHATVFGCMRIRDAGESLYDPSTNTVSLMYDEYRSQCAANSLTSKGMFQLIQRKGSSRHLMALLNTDGSVAKAWPVHTIDSDGKPISGSGAENGIGSPMYGPLQISKAEPVNIQFGHFGISAWPSDTGGTSHASSVDENKGEWNETGSKYYSSCCSSPRMSDGPAKELKEDQSVSGSDEEDDDGPEIGSEDLSDDDVKHTQEDLEGSVDEGSTKSDEEYDDLAMEDLQDNGYWSDDDDDGMKKSRDVSVLGTHKKDVDLLLRSRSDSLTELPCSYSLFTEKTEMNLPRRLRKRSLSIPPFSSKDRLGGLIVSGPPEREI